MSKSSPIISKNKPDRVFLRYPKIIYQSFCKEKYDLSAIYSQILACRRLGDDNVEEHVKREISVDLGNNESEVHGMKLVHYLSKDWACLSKLTKKMLDYESYMTRDDSDDDDLPTDPRAKQHEICSRDNAVFNNIIELTRLLNYICGLYFSTGKFEREQSIRLKQN
jgi:hypothetical protein